MSRWLIEKSGSGIEKAGSGIEKAGSGIEKAGSGIEKAGSGIEKAGSGLQKFFFAIAISSIAFASQVSASDKLDPVGAMQLVVNDQNIAVSWIIDGSVFSGVAKLSGSFANMALTEVGFATRNDSANPEEAFRSKTGIDVFGSGTGKDVYGSGTGKDVHGSGTGKDVHGSGTGTDVYGSGTGTDVYGSGTGTDVYGSGTGTDVYGSGTGKAVYGSGTGADAIAVTLPGGKGMQMEVALGCNSATVSVMDSNFSEIVSFDNVPVFGASGYCSGGSQGFGGYFDPKMPTEFGARK